MNNICCNCECLLVDEWTESQLYSPNVTFFLCVDCDEKEEELIESTGTNDHPELVQMYMENCK